MTIMKRLLLFIALLLASIYAHATTIVASQPIVGPNGTLFTGKITFMLPSPATDTTTSTVILPTPFTTRVFGGILASTLSVRGNDVLSPSMYYVAYYYDAQGKYLTNFNYRITGATFDIGAAPMTPVTTSNISQLDWTVNNLSVNVGVNMCSTCVLKWSADTGISRTAAATFAFGNGTQGSLTATLKATTYQAGTATWTATAARQGDGTAGAPAFSFASETTTGFFRPGAGGVAFTSASTTYIIWAANLHRMGSGGNIGFSSNVNPNSAVSDIVLSRAAPGVAQLGTSETPNLNGTLRLARTRTTGGTAAATGDFTLSAAWGNTATKVAFTGNDAAGSISITANGAGIAANPTVTFVFHDGTWGTQPTCVVGRNDTSGVAAGTGSGVGNATSATQGIFGLFATPTAGNTYVLTWSCQ